MVRVYPIISQSQFKKNSRATVPLNLETESKKIYYSVQYTVDRCTLHSI